MGRYLKGLLTAVWRKDCKRQGWGKENIWKTTAVSVLAKADSLDGCVVLEAVGSGCSWNTF